jgi:hypothetical protein
MRVKTLVSVAAISVGCWSVAMGANAAVDTHSTVLNLPSNGTFIKGSTIRPMTPGRYGGAARSRAELHTVIVHQPERRADGKDGVGI